MGVVNRYTVYQMAEMVLIGSEGTTIVPVFSIPAGTVIEHVMVRVKTPAVRVTGAVTMTLGDVNSADGFVVACDAKAAIGTVFGGDPTERGAYLYDATKKGSFLKHYSLVNTLRFVLNVAPDVQGEYEVIVFGKRYSV